MTERFDNCVGPLTRPKLTVEERLAALEREVAQINEGVTRNYSKVYVEISRLRAAIDPPPEKS